MQRFAPVCEFDGRLSAVRFGGHVYLYARANTRPEGSGRAVQVTHSADGLSGWSPFQMLEFACGTRVEPRDADYYWQFAGWRLYNVYLFVARPHADGLLAGLFPATFVVQGSPDILGGLFLCFSADGVRWSTPQQLLKSAVFGARIIDWPVDYQLSSDGAAQPTTPAAHTLTAAHAAATVGSTSL